MKQSQNYLEHCINDFMKAVARSKGPYVCAFSMVRELHLKETRSVTMNIFRKKYFLIKSFVKIELSYIFTINMVSTAENCKEK